MTFPFEQLEVWRRSIDLAEEILKFIDRDVDRKDAFSVGEQLRRAVISISNNIAEGGGRNNKKEKKYFYNIARGSLFEVVSLLELCRRRGCLKPPAHGDFYREAEEISKMLAGLINATGKIRESN